jgi:mono/diheme cytochrome c family protein
MSRRLRRIAFLLAALLFAGHSASAQARPTVTAAQTMDGGQLYLEGCATCHGADGRGMDRALVAFEEELPDFTDCSFASREPAADWVTIAQRGGPVRGFSQMMPSFDDALGEEALARVIAHVQQFCRDSKWPRGELNLPRTLATEKAYPEDEWVLENEMEVDGPAVGHALIYEKRFGSRSQIELELPFSYRREDGAAPDGAGWSGGIGDAVVALKQVLTHSVETGHILSAVLETKLPTGDEARGFGAGALGLEGFLTYGQILPSDLFVQAQAGAERSNRAGSETEVFWTGGLGWSWAQNGWGRTWSPILEVAGVREGDEGTLWDILPQMHVTLNTRQHVMLTVGTRLPLNERERSPTLVVNFLWDWFDGGLRDGW